MLVVVFLTSCELGSSPLLALCHVDHALGYIGRGVVAILCHVRHRAGCNASWHARTPVIVLIHALHVEHLAQLLLPLFLLYLRVVNYLN